MSNADQNYEHLSNKLNELLRKHELFQNEILSVRQELNKIKEATSIPAESEESNNITIPETDVHPNQNLVQEPPITEPVKKAKKEKSFSFERFIGENLFNKIGIVILVIGVSIGTKYAIDNELIGPEMRIILGYILGLGLLGVAIKLKKKFEGFSAVLLSGSMAILYFITYAAYSFYSLIPQGVTFGFLIFFTVATVVASISYNRQIIAHIGLVGAYAVPFLFSQNPDQVAFLFNYTALINAGILIIAILRYWKLLYLSAFSITWLLFFSWYVGAFKPTDDFTLAFTFLIIYFVLFFATFIIYKLLKTTKFDFLDIILVVFNSFIFYGIGYSLLSNNSVGEDYLGLFTLTTALAHFIVAYIVYTNKLADRNLFYLVAGMVLVFLTIAFPVQFDGGWVTMFWAGEALILFWIGRSKSVKIYEYLSYPLIIIAFFSLVQDWGTGYNTYILDQPETKITPFLNLTFLTSVFVIAAYSILFRLNLNKNIQTREISNGLVQTMRIVIPSLLIVTIFITFWMEISNYWGQLYTDSAIERISEGNIHSFFNYDSDLRRFKTIWLLNYSLIFLSIITIANITLKSKKVFSWIIFGFNAMALLIYLPGVLFELSELRENYLAQTMAEYFDRGIYHILIRYISFIFVALLLVSTYRLYNYLGKKLEIGFHLLISGSLLWILSSELLHWFDIANVPNSYKMGLSIFWGIYALIMVIYGIRKRKPHIRITAFGILGFTLIKLFVYDLSHMSLISKSLIFILLGIVFLGISFLYNKYKNMIFDEN